MQYEERFGVPYVDPSSFIELNNPSYEIVTILKSDSEQCVRCLVAWYIVWWIYVARCWLLSTLFEFLRIKIIQSWNLSQLLLV